MPAGSFAIEALAKRHDRSAFSCGRPALDRYLIHQAGQEMRRQVAAVFVLVRDGDSTVRGYYTLSSFAIDIESYPPEWARKLPRYPLLPATLLGRLAVDHSLHGQGLGALLLLNAIDRARRSSVEIGSTAVVVDAIDGSAAAFYRKFGFLPMAERDDRLFLPMAAVARLLS